MAADTKDEASNEDTGQWREIKRRRTNAKMTMKKKKIKKPHLPRPKKPLTFELAKHMITQEPSTPTQTDSLKAREARVRSSTPGTGPEPPLIRLSRIDILFSAIHRRNKNQHRNQLFYKHFSFLRRSVKKLIGLHERSAALSGGTTSVTGASKTTVVPSATETRQRFEKELQLRSQREVLEEHVRETLIPAAYVAFSGVVADTQFANLGVVLLGILADIVGVVGSMRKIEGIKGQEKDWRNTERTGNGGRLVALSTLVTGPDHGAVVERVYDSDGGLKLDESSSKMDGRSKILGEEGGFDMGEVVQRDEEVDKNTAEVSKLHRIKLQEDQEESDDKEQEANTDSTHSQTLIGREQEEEHTSMREKTPTLHSKTLHTAVSSRRNTSVPSDSNRKDKVDIPKVAGKSNTSSAGDSKAAEAVPPTTKVSELANPTIKPLKTSSSKASSKTETRRKDTGREKTKKKSKKKANAIDDLFNGFG